MRVYRQTHRRSFTSTKKLHTAHRILLIGLLVVRVARLPSFRCPLLVGAAHTSCSSRLIVFTGLSLVCTGCLSALIFSSLGRMGQTPGGRGRYHPASRSPSNHASRLTVQKASISTNAPTSQSLAFLSHSVRPQHNPPSVLPGIRPSHAAVERAKVLQEVPPLPCVVAVLRLRPQERGCHNGRKPGANYHAHVQKMPYQSCFVAQGSRSQNVGNLGGCRLCPRKCSPLSAADKYRR